MDCQSFNPYQLFGSINQKQMMKKKNIKIKMFTLDLLSSHQNFDGGKGKYKYRHLNMRPTKKGKPQITYVGKWVRIRDVVYHKFFIQFS